MFFCFHFVPFMNIYILILPNSTLTNKVSYLEIIMQWYTGYTILLNFIQVYVVQISDLWYLNITPLFTQSALLSHLKELLGVIVLFLKIDSSIYLRLIKRYLVQNLPSKFSKIFKDLLSNLSHRFQLLSLVNIRAACYSVY